MISTVSLPVQNIPFDKYEQRGAYHWGWYTTNKFSYKDKLHMIRLYLPRKGTVLDIGGGDGVLSYLLFEHGLNVLCVDSNAYAIKLADVMVRKALYGSGLPALIRRLLSESNIRPRPLAKRYEAGELKFSAESVFELKVQEPFDYIVCHEVIEHIPEPDKLVEWIGQNMRHYAIISTPNVSNRPQHELDYHSWTAETFADFLSDYRHEFIFNDGYDMYIKIYK